MNENQSKVALQCYKSPKFFMDSFIREECPMSRLFDKNCNFESITNDSKHQMYGYLFWQLIFRSTIIVIVSNTHDEAKEFMVRLWKDFSTIPEWLRPNLKNNTTFEKQLSNGSKIKSVYQLPSIRGFGFENLVFNNISLMDTETKKKWYYPLEPQMTYCGKTISIDDVYYPTMKSMIHTS